MIANTLLFTLAILIACLFWLMGELKFLMPSKRLIFHQYGTVLLAWLGIFFVNLFAAVYWIQRKFFLKDTGRKLRHIDSQTSGSPMPISLPDGDWNAR